MVFPWRDLLLSTLPLLLWHPEGFSPWQVQQRYNLYTHILPHAGMIITAWTIALGICLGWRAGTRESLFLACGSVLLLPILAGATFNSLQLGRPTLLFYGWYSIASMLFLSLPAFPIRPHQHPE